MIPHHLATGKWFYSHGVETILIIGVVFTLIGLFFGYLIWSYRKYQIKRIQTTNAKLQDKKTILIAHQAKLSEFIQPTAK